MGSVAARQTQAEWFAPDTMSGTEAALYFESVSYKPPPDILSGCGCAQHRQKWPYGNLRLTLSVRWRTAAGSNQHNAAVARSAPKGA